MTLDDLKQIIKKENTEMEFKSTTAEVHKACRTLCAFLNRRGGYVFIGIKNDGRVVGQMVTDPTSQEIANDIRKIEPPASVEVHYVPVDKNKFVIVMYVPAGDHMPYIFDGRPYHRVENQTAVMPQHLYEQLLVKRGQLNHAWDEYTNEEYTVEELDYNEIHNMIKRGISYKRIPPEALEEDTVDVLKSLKLLRDGKLTNAAIVLFAKKMSSKFYQCMIKMARFKGISELDDFVDNQQVCGNAFEILAGSSSFMEKHLNISSYFPSDSFVRVDKFTVPILAVRESIINAICHRDYQNNSTITLAILDDRMEVWNSGFLPKQLTLEDLKKKHGSYPRNKLIAKTLFKFGLIETWGGGTVKMINECRLHGISDPVFQEYSSGFSVQFIFKEPIGPRAAIVPLKQKIDTEIPEISHLSKRQREILDILSKFSELRAVDIMKNLQAPPSERTLRDDLAFLKKRGLIASRGRGLHAAWYKV